VDRQQRALRARHGQLLITAFPWPAGRLGRPLLIERRGRAGTFSPPLCGPRPPRQGQLPYRCASFLKSNLVGLPRIAPTSPFITSLVIRSFWRRHDAEADCMDDQADRHERSVP
jgi:hypothetical protein